MKKSLRAYVTEEGGEEGCVTIEREEGRNQVVFTNRMLVYLFATDDSFGQLMRLPKQAFHMACGNQLCVNLRHVDTEAGGPPTDLED